MRIFIRFLSEVFAEFQVKTLEDFLSEKLWRIFKEMSTPQYQSYGGTAKTPQYQSYGGTTARTDSSPASRLDVFKKPLDPDLLAKVRNCICKPITFNNTINKLFLIIDIVYQFKYAQHKLKTESFISKTVKAAFLKIVDI